MSINIGPDPSDDLRPRITVIGVGGAGGNAIANMMEAEIEGVDFIVANTVGLPGVGFGDGDNAGWLLGSGGARHPLERADKRTFARRLVERLVPALTARFGRDEIHGG